ncbi:MAG: hypothetical protein NXI01_00800 [Gammaproteobacteria bacterium]|nr:hypothetical protein [Gammaproteobacteria bacterium]
MKHIAFVLFHTGETKALLPTIQNFMNQTDHYRVSIIPVGQTAKNNLPQSLNPVIRIPSFIDQGLGQNDENNISFDDDYVQEVVSYCQDYQYIVLGSAAIIQTQIAVALPPTKQRLIYFDIGFDPDRVQNFLPYAEAFFMTSRFAQQDAVALIAESKMIKKPAVLLGRHGDIDTWQQQYLDNVKNSTQIRNMLHVEPSDKIIVWAGRYDVHLSKEGREALAFKLFLDNFKDFAEHYKLRITLHPGIKGYPEKKLQALLDDYYIQPLLDSGMDPSHVITQSNTLPAVSIAHAVVSLGSTVGAQSVCIGTRAKNVYLPDMQPIRGIESVKSEARWQFLLKSRWPYKKRRKPGTASYKRAMHYMGVPSVTTEEVLVAYLG